jgi:hypothetical protein
MSYTIHTLIDITPTGKHRNRNDEGKAVDQQTNWLTFQNCAMLRTNMEFGKVSMKEQIVDKYLFGKDFEGKQKVWSVTVTPDRSDVVTLDMLQEDFDLVPMITGLDESIKKHNELFLTKDEHKTNILFINTSDNADNT